MFENPTVYLKALYNLSAKVACCSSELIFTYINADSRIQNAKEYLVSCVYLL
jgi:hypothetical protein